MKTGSLLSVSIRVHPWLDHIACGFAALRCIAELHSAVRRGTRCMGPIQRSADYESAILQIENLRYDLEA